MDRLGIHLDNITCFIRRNNYFRCFSVMYSAVKEAPCGADGLDRPADRWSLIFDEEQRSEMQFG